LPDPVGPPREEPTPARHSSRKSPTSYSIWSATTASSAPCATIAATRGRSTWFSVPGTAGRLTETHHPLASGAAESRIGQTPSSRRLTARGTRGPLCASGATKSSSAGGTCGITCAGTISAQTWNRVWDG
jgi:hypothetical protein